MKLYHGSYLKIDGIDLSKAKPYKDFGRAFYLTKYYEQAKSWANRLSQEHGTESVVTEFDFDEYAYEDDSLKVQIFEKYNEQWRPRPVHRAAKRHLHCPDPHPRGSPDKKSSPDPLTPSRPLSAGDLPSERLFKKLPLSSGVEFFFSS